MIIFGASYCLVFHFTEAQYSWSGPQDKIFKPDQSSDNPLACIYAGEVTALSPEECKASCEQSKQESGSGCNAINYSPRNYKCYMKFCAIPIPEPNVDPKDNWHYADQKSYYMIGKT